MANSIGKSLGISGMSTRTAQDAGVRIDLPLTNAEKEAQSLVDQLQSEEAAEQKATDPRTPFEKKYDIRDGIAHITPDKFSDLLRKPHDIINLSNLKVLLIEIDNGNGISANFEFYDHDHTDTKDWPIEHVVHSSTIVKQGLSNTCTKQSASIIYNEKKVYGILREGELTPELLAHVRLGQINQQTKTVPKKFIPTESSANAALINSDFLRIVLKQMEYEGTPNLPLVFNRESNGININLGHISALPQDPRTLPLITLPVIKTFICSRASKDPERILSDIFQGKSEVLICSDQPYLQPVALLRHPELDNTDLTP